MKMKRILTLFASLAVLAGCAPVSNSSGSDSSDSTSSSTTTSEKTEFKLDLSIGEGVTSLEVHQGDKVLDETALNTIKSGTDLVATASVAEHYSIDELALDGSTLNFDETAGGYAFKMPEHDATLSATAVRSEFAVLSIDDLQTSVDVVLKVDGAELQEGVYLTAGTAITVEVTNPYGQISSIYQSVYVHVNDEVYYFEEDLSSSSETTASFTFPMPAADAEIVLACNSGHNAQNTGAAITFDVSEGLEVFGYAPDHKYENVFFGTLRRDSGYKVVSFEYCKNNNDVWLPFSAPLDFINNVASFTLSGFYGAETVEVKIVAESVGVKKINYVNLDSVVFGGNDVLVEEAVPGDVINAYSISAKEGFSVLNITIEGADSPNVSYNQYGGTWSYRFVVSDSDVTVTFDVAEYGEIIATCDDGVESFKIYDSEYTDRQEITQAAANANVFIFPTIKSGFILTGASVGVGEDVTHVDPSQTYISGVGNVMILKLKMPADGSDLVVAIETATSYTVTLQENENININGLPASYAPGAQVTLYAQIKNALYEIESVSVAEDVELEITVNGTSISFVMPAANITLVVNLKEKPSTLVDFVVEDSAEAFSRTNISQYSTGVNVDGSQEDIKMLIGQTASLSVDVSKAGYEPVVTVSNTDGSSFTAELNYYNNGSYLYTITIDDAIASISVVSKPMSPAQITINDLTGDSVEGTLYRLDSTGSPVAINLDSDELFNNDAVYYTVTTQAPESFAYVVTYWSEVDGELVEVRRNNSGAYVIANENLTIKIEKVESCTITVNSTASSCYPSLWNITKDESVSTSGTTLVSKGDKIEIRVNSWGVNFDITITMEGSEDIVVTNTNNYDNSSNPLVVSGNVTITISDTAQ